MVTETPIFTISHSMKLTALTPSDILESRLVMPRASKAPGTTTVAAPYSADHATSERPVTSHASPATPAPTAACAATTHHGDTVGCLSLKACASSRVSLLKGKSSAASASLPRSKRSFMAKVTVGPSKASGLYTWKPVQLGRTGRSVASNAVDDLTRRHCAQAATLRLRTCGPASRERPPSMRERI